MLFDFIIRLGKDLQGRTVLSLCEHEEVKKVFSAELFFAAARADVAKMNSFLEDASLKP